MNDKIQGTLPAFFAELAELRCVNTAEIFCTSDGFYITTVTVAEILARRDITTVPGRQGNLLECSLFFDDWYLYAVADGSACTYGLLKMREQEYDAKLGRNADGDIPGVTVSFIALQMAILLDCLRDPSQQNRHHLNKEINRVVADRGQHHSEPLKQYFIRTQAQGPYLIAARYTEYIASLAQDGRLPVPERYEADYQKQGTAGRIPQFIEENNTAAGKVICDHRNIYISDPICPTDPERMAILATHTGNTSVYSFAAEIQFHAKFLTWWAKLPIPVIGRSAYASAIRADLSIGDAEFTGPTPYYRADSAIVKKQYDCHKHSKHTTYHSLEEVTL